MLHFAVPFSAGIGALFQLGFDFSIYRQVFLIADGMLKPLSAATVKPNRFSLIASPFRRDRRSALSAALVLRPDKNCIRRRDGHKRNRTASKAGRPDNCEALSGNSHRQAYPALTRPSAPADRPVEYCGIHSSAHADIRLQYGHPAV